LLAVGVLVLAVVPVSMGAPVLGHPAALSSNAPPGLLATSALSHTLPATPHPTIAGVAPFNPPCHKIATTICVSIQNPGETNIVPAANQFVASVEPNASESLPIVIKSYQPLNYTGDLHNTSQSPMALNVTGVLWNGDPYYSIYDNSVWHSSTQSWWQGPLTGINNKSYPYWYVVNFSARASTGPNFFAGQAITWWIYLNLNNSFKHTTSESARFHFTYSGAWPYSPYPNSPEYAGASSVLQDLNLTLTPRSPNWNDTVLLTVNATQADVLSNATIGSAFMDLHEYLSNGALALSSTVNFPVTVNAASFGAVTTSALIPAMFAQIAGATISVQIGAYDVPGDELLTPSMNYTVGGNGSFQSGVFSDDIALSTAPTAVGAGVGSVSVDPGAVVNVTIVSRNAGTAINSAEILYTFGYPALGEKAYGAIQLTRLSSIVFVGHLPGLPLGSVVNFSVYAWDFNQRLEVSPTLGYVTPTFAQYVPIVAGNSSFFYVFVYDNGSQSWVSGAKVQIQGPNGFVNSVSNTTLGVAYPNATRTPFIPLLLPANASYLVTVVDPWFVPPGARSTTPINVTVVALHSMTLRQSLQQGANDLVVLEGNSILFYLNATPPMPTVSPSVQSGIPSSVVPAAAVFGFLGATIALAFIGPWWIAIRRRRKEEEKRVTL
ncbi:MAG: hypothetical protein L3K23_11055, partial [Thermoplasmata archaeon]|nr:hypothetical protein [Thermoplasmata archaeon]